jgi:hypothetical protein
MLLLTDGTMVCQEIDAQGFGTRSWHKVTPDIFGSYMNGAWSAIAPLPDNPIIPAAVGGPTNAPLYFASGILRDGKLYVIGGEYNLHHPNADIRAAQIYDPAADAWTIIPDPGWPTIGDAPSCVLPDGTLLLGHIDDTQTAIYDPATNDWLPIGGKQNRCSEETWTLLPDETVLTANCFGHPQTEKFVFSSNSWVTAGQTPPANDLVDDLTKEIGPALLLPDGRVFAVGATGNTAIYTMPALPNQPGTWSQGPPFPQINGQTLGATDGPGCLLPNGDVLCIVGPVSSNCNNPVDLGYCPPSYFFEFNPSGGTLTQAPNPANNPMPPGSPGNATFVGRLLLLPTGEVLFANGSNVICMYKPGGAPNPSWKPQITDCPGTLNQGQTYMLRGRQLNGVSQANSYGDDVQQATNYPLVRITNLTNQHVFYCGTTNFSTMAVATGTAIHSTDFTVPPGAETGAYELTVVANGIASDPVVVTVGKLPEELYPMSTSILNVWITKLGDPCKIANEHDALPNYDWVVAVFHCDGSVLNWSEGRYRYHREDPWIPIRKHVPPGGMPGWWYDSIPARDGHVEIELPKGCYVVRAALHSWFQEGRLYGNWATDRAIVEVCCGEMVCAQLYAPTAHSCQILMADIVYPLLLKHGVIDERLRSAIETIQSAIHQFGDQSGFEKGLHTWHKQVFGLMRPDDDYDPESQLDHFKIWKIRRRDFHRGVRLKTQFDDKAMQQYLSALEWLGNPVKKTYREKDHEIGEPAAHFLGYRFANDDPDFKARWWVQIKNQFYHEPAMWNLGSPTMLLVPASKVKGHPPGEPPELPRGMLNHFECYQARADETIGPVWLEDQIDKILERKEKVTLEPAFLGVPVEKNSEQSPFENAHLAIYRFKEHRPLKRPAEVTARDQFDTWPLEVEEALFLGVPTVKMIWGEMPTGSAAGGLRERQG